MSVSPVEPFTITVPTVGRGWVSLSDEILWPAPIYGSICAATFSFSTTRPRLVPYLFYGFYQEVVYRGMLQSELVRRWGAFAGVLVANLLYTFGPLH